MQREADSQGAPVAPSPESAGIDGRIMTLDEAAEYLKISYSTAYRLVIDGELKAFRIRNSWRTSTGACHEFVCQGSGELTPHLRVKGRQVFCHATQVRQRMWCQITRPLTYLLEA